METLGTIFRYLYSFLKSFGGVLILAVVIIAIVKIVFDAKKPRLNEKLKQNNMQPPPYNNTPPQQYNNVPSPPPGMQSGYIPQQGQYQNNYGQGPMYPNYMPYQRPMFDPQLQKKKQQSDRVATLIVILFSIIPVTGVIIMIVSFVGCFYSISACGRYNREQSEEYQAALTALEINVESDQPEEISVYDESYSKLFATE